MKKSVAATLLVLVLTGMLNLVAQTRPNAVQNEAHLRRVVRQFKVTDTTMLEAVASLSSELSAELHMGFEEILRAPDSTNKNVRFSIDLQNASVEDILNTLCQFDARYTWSVDGASINIYPRVTADEATYLLNLVIDKIQLTNIPDPDKVFPPLHERLPKEQLAYAQLGGDISYETPWTTRFEHVTVRQLMNRVAEHLGPRSSWILRGATTERVFTFQRGEFHVLSGGPNSTQAR